MFVGVWDRGVGVGVGVDADAGAGGDLSKWGWDHVISNNRYFFRIIFVI